MSHVDKHAAKQMLVKFIIYERVSTDNFYVLMINYSCINICFFSAVYIKFVFELVDNDLISIYLEIIQQNLVKVLNLNGKRFCLPQSSQVMTVLGKSDGAHWYISSSTKLN